MWCFGEGFSWWPWLGGTGMIILWIALIAFVVWGIISFTGRYRFNSKSSALDTAKERYAEGEISKDEYDQYKKNL